MSGKTEAKAAMLAAIDAYRPEILAAERHIWKHPETGYREWKTHAYLKEKYEALGYVLTEAGNIPGFYTDIDTGREGPTIAVFGELDSLIVPSHPESDPETGAVHACGHNAQSAALLGVAAALKAPHALDALCGKIRLIAVPAEEMIELTYREELRAKGVIRYFGGKQEFLYRGYLDGVDLAFMVHIARSNTLGCGKGSNGFLTKRATFHGKACHASTPEHGVNAIYAATCALNAANALRETFPEKDTLRFHPIITNGGASVNSIPDTVTVESYVRGHDIPAMTRTNRKVNLAFAASAAAIGANVTLTDYFGYAPRYNDPLLWETMADASEDLFEKKPKQTNEWDMGCSDMGDVSCVIPSIHPHIGGATGTAHGADFRISDPELACVKCAKAQAATLAFLLADGAARAKEVLANAKVPYKSVKEYLAAVDAFTFSAEAVTYREDGTVTLTVEKAAPKAE